VIGYLRVSTGEQVQHGYGLDTQAQAVRDWCAREYGDRPYQLDIYRDEGISGRLGYQPPPSGRGKYRPGLGQVVERLRAGTVDVLVVYDLSRLYRDHLEGLKFTSEFFSEGSPSRLVSVTEPVDLSSIEGEMSLDMFLAAAAYFRKQTARKVRHGLAQRRLAGYATGKLPYGWRGTKAANGGRPGIEPLPEQIQWVQEAFRLVLAGHGTRQIAQELNTRAAPTGAKDLNWTAQRVRRLLTQPMHAGLIRDGEGTRRGAHWEQRIVEPEEFKRLQALLRGRYRERHTYRGKELQVLWKLARCGDCGRPVTVIHAGGKPHYHCQGALQAAGEAEPGSAAPSSGAPADGRICRGWTKSAALIERRLLRLLGEAVQTPEFRRLARREARDVVLNRDRRQATRRLQEQERARRENRSQQERLLQAFTLAALNEEVFAERQQTLAEAQSRLDEEITRLRGRTESRKSQEALLEQVLGVLPELDRIWADLPADERRQLVANLTEFVVLERLGHGRLRLRVKVHYLREWEANLGNARSREMGGKMGVEHLTQRELALLYWVDQGKSIPEIAELWQAARSGLYCLRRSILARLEVARMRDAVRQARQRLREEQDRLPLLEVSTGCRGYAGYRPRREQRQEQALRLFAEGSSRAEAARELGLSLETVRVYEWRIRQRYGVETLAEAVARWQAGEGDAA